MNPFVLNPSSKSIVSSGSKLIATLALALALAPQAEARRKSPPPPPSPVEVVPQAPTAAEIELENRKVAITQAINDSWFTCSNSDGTRYNGQYYDQKPSIIRTVEQATSIELDPTGRQPGAIITHLWGEIYASVITLSSRDGNRTISSLRISTKTYKRVNLSSTYTSPNVQYRWVESEKVTTCVPYVTK